MPRRKPSTPSVRLRATWRVHAGQATPPERLAGPREAAALVVGQPQSLVPELLAEDGDLGPEVGDHVLLLAVDPAGQEQDGEADGQGRRHGSLAEARRASPIGPYASAQAPSIVGSDGSPGGSGPWRLTVPKGMLRE